MSQKEVNLHPKQFEAFNFKTQYCAAIAGVQSGKTFLGAHWLLKQIYDYPKKYGLIAAPSYKILNQSTLPKFFEEFPHFRRFYKEQKSEIQLPTGGIVFIRSMDNPLGIEGMTIDYAWLDEAGQMPQMAWTVIRSRTSTTKGRVLITTTPYNMGWLYQHFYTPWKNKKDKDLTVVSWASTDSPYFPEEFYNKEMARLRPEEFDRRYRGEFARMQGLVYELKDWHKIPQKSLKPDTVIGGIDWGYTNPAALVVIKIEGDKYYIVDEWYQTGKTTPEIIEAAMELQEKHRVSRWYADSANPEKVTEAATNTGLYVVPYKKSRDAISAGISMVQQLLNESRLFVFRRCSNSIAEFETYHYPEGDELNTKEKPVEKDNHIMDSIRYAIHGFTPAKRYPRTPSKVNPISTLLSRKPNELNRSQQGFTSQFE